MAEQIITDPGIIELIVKPILPSKELKPVPCPVRERKQCPYQEQTIPTCSQCSFLDEEIREFDSDEHPFRIARTERHSYIPETRIIFIGMKNPNNPNENRRVEISGARQGKEILIRRTR